jgi:AAHS family 4-hydroxybenzoate transporter-like MFS transporter
MNDDVRPRHDATLDADRLGRRQVTVVILCALVAMVDGFDTQSIALAAPNVAASWHASPAAFGPIFGIGLFGGLPGAIAFGFNRIGRKPSLLVAMALFAVVSLLTPLTDSVATLAVVRLITGFGLGGALPSITSC